MRKLLEVYIPGFSVLALLAVTGYILSDAIAVIQSGGEDDEVDIAFLWGFSVGNFVVDFFSSLMFYLRGKNALLSEKKSNSSSVCSSHAPLNTFSLDRQSIDMQKRSFIPERWIPNLNMVSALTHVSGDTLRTTSVFIAALIATVSGASGALCDAWASVVVSFTIVICVIPLCREIYRAAVGHHSEEEEKKHTVSSSATQSSSQEPTTVNTTLVIP
jgi:Co/Zn/Cd efflux system component